MTQLPGPRCCPANRCRRRRIPAWPRSRELAPKPTDHHGSVPSFACESVPVGAVRAEQREAHRLVGALLDSLGARIVVEVRLGESRAAALTLIPVDSSSIAMASVIALR